jgi:hypothetical protein
MRLQYFISQRMLALVNNPKINILIYAHLDYPAFKFNQVKCNNILQMMQMAVSLVFTISRFSPQALQDLTNVQATVVERNQKLDDMESRDSSLKVAIDTEVVQMRKELMDVRDELQRTRQARDGDLKEFEDREKHIEKEKLAEILKGLFSRIYYLRQEA